MKVKLRDKQKMMDSEARQFRDTLLLESYSTPLNMGFFEPALPIAHIVTQNKGSNRETINDPTMCGLW